MIDAGWLPGEVAYSEKIAASASVLIMFCPHCGNENEADVRFCGHCGRPIGEPARPSGSVAQHDPVESVRVVAPGEAVDVVSPALKWGVLAASVLMPLIGIAMGLFYWIRAESDDKVAVGKVWFFGALAIGVLYGLIGGL